MSLSPEEKFMKEALIESKKALPFCLPNPPVGCVIVQDDRIISKGYTRMPGYYHAEAMALSKLKDSSIASYDLYVTLEPCSYHGKTPSCAKLITKNNIGSVYIGLVDPDIKNNGNGINILLSAGINVEIGILANPIKNFIGHYLRHA